MQPPADKSLMAKSADVDNLAPSEISIESMCRLESCLRSHKVPSLQHEMS